MDPPDLAVQDIGHGLPVLIIHGWTMAGFVEAHDFEPVFVKTPGYRRIYVDLPGMGRTPVGTVHDLDAMFAHVAAFVERHVLPARFLVIGTSCGAYLARALAYRYADAVDGLLLRVPVVEPASSKRDVDAFAPVISNAAVLSSLSSAEREKLGDIAVQTPDYVETIKRKFDATVLPAIAAADADVLDPIREDPKRYRLTAAMHSPSDTFPKPTLILTGRQDAVVGYRDAWSLVPCYPRATFVVLDRADHGLPVDETGLFESLVENWLWRVEESRRMSLPIEKRSS